MQILRIGMRFLFDCANDMLYDSVFYSLYLNIPLKYTHLRIELYRRGRILKYNRSRDIHGRVASL